MEASKMTDQFGTADITSDDKLWTALSYVFSPLVPVILLLMEDKKARPFIKFHAVQSLAVGIVLIIVVPIIAVITLGCGSILWLIMFYWAYKAYQGEMFNIPVVTDFIKKQGWV
jgi:uncharacterized membrane protein